MMFRNGIKLVAASIAATAIACSNSNSTSPSGSSSTTGSVTVPRASQPPANAAIRYVDQPVVLGVQNAAVTSTSGTVYTFEVATDTAFASKVQTKDNVAAGSNGATTVKLDSLAGSKDYYWHARATAGGTSGPFSAVAKFTMGAPVTISPPAPLGPLTGTTTPPRPDLHVANAAHTGPAGPITYLFEIATSSAFTTIVMSATKSEGAGATSFVPGSDLPIGATFFWRATAIDASNGISSGPNAPQSFTTRALSQAENIAQLANIELWPGVQPPGTYGHAIMGDDPMYGVGWYPQTLYYFPQNLTFQCPDAEMLRFFDLFDRGFDPDSAIAWMNANGYPTAALWYPPPEKAVLGLHTVYIAARGKIVTNGTWDIVLRIE